MRISTSTIGQKCQQAGPALKALLSFQQGHLLRPRASCWPLLRCSSQLWLLQKPAFPKVSTPAKQKSLAALRSPTSTFNECASTQRGPGVPGWVKCRSCLLGELGIPRFTTKYSLQETKLHCKRQTYKLILTPIPSWIP